jgi:spore coat polysaccharide biosynthesis predicted glycosyltransferase SpsG
VAVFDISPEEAIDIDTMQDWWIVEKYLDRKKVAIRVDGERRIGFGHMYRMLLLANRLLDHPFRFFLDESQTEAVSMVQHSFYPFVAAPRNQILQRIAEYEPEIVILDILDTTAADVLFLRDRGVFVVSFEDLGPGMLHTDLTINALYERPLPDPHVLSGPDYYCLREDFAHTAPPPIADTVKHIVITFGGADPTNQTKRTLTALGAYIREHEIHLTIILGLGYPLETEEDLTRAVEKLGLGDQVTLKREVQSMARELKNANLIVTSCGRTMYEIASLGIPAVLIAQNTREMQHAFGHAENGFACLGLGRDVSDTVLLETVREICDDAGIRAEMRRRMLSYDFRGGQERVTRLILDRFRESRRHR